jgi:hypothetical protein
VVILDEIGTHDIPRFGPSRGGKDLLLLDVIVVYRLVIVSSRARV